MPSKSKTITADIVQELRTLFRREYEQNPPDAPFHPTDMERIEKSDKWLARFLRTYELDVEQSFQKLWETCIWRQTYGANDLSELNLRHDYLQLPIVFAHNYDIDGYPLLIFQCRYHTSGSKDMDAFMRCVVYWIERVHRTHGMSKISLIFDLSDTGLKSVDMDFVVRVMNLFKFYYPSAINLIIIYEIPWVLNAAFSLVKRLLSANALEVLRVCTKKDITKFIDKDNCLADWGGNDNYEYVYLPEKRPMNESIIQVTISEDNTLKSTNSSDNIVKHIYQNNQTWIENPSDKYNDNNYKNTLDKNVPEGGSNTEIIAKSLNDVQSLQSSEEVHFDTLTTNQMDNLKNFQDLHTPPEQTMLRLSPTEQLAFPYGGETSECHLEITSSARTRVTYKIQTTSPEKFRVRPRCGILMPGETVSISIFLKPEHKLADGNKDKFLIMSLALPPDYEVALQQLADLWKTKTPLDSDVEQHRLCCHYKAASAPIGSGSGACTGNSAEPGQTAAASSFADERNYLDMILTRHQKKFEKQMRRQHMLTYLTLLFVIMIAIAVGYLLKLKIYPENCYVKSSNQ